MPTAADSVHERALTALAAAYTALALSGIEDVRTQMLLNLKPLKYPCIVLSLDDANEEVSGDNDDSFETDGWVLPINVQILDRASKDFQQRRPYYLGWRRALMRYTKALTTLSGVPEVWDVSVTPQHIVEPVAVAYGTLVSAFWARVAVAEAKS